MPTVDQVKSIVDRVRVSLEDAEHEGIYLKVESEKLDDDWLYVVVVPSKPGIRASDHAEVMSRIERNLRKEGVDRVLLVPAIED